MRLALLALLAFTTTCGAQDFPVRPVRIIVPYAVGNGADIFTRVLGDELSKKWGQQVIVDNKLGSGGVLAALELKKGRGDGHEYMLGDVGILAINPAVFRKLAYDAEKDFAPVTDLLHVPWVFFTAKSSQFKTLGDLIAAAKADPGKYTFSSNGVGTPTFLAAELLKLRAGIDLLHVPFRDGNQMRVAATTGDVTLLTTVMASARPVLERLTPLAVTAPSRQAAYPDVPTVAESGGPAGLNLTAWSTLMARPDTPPAVLHKVYTDVIATLQRPEVRKRAAELGFDVGGRTPEQVRDFIRAEARTYREIVEVTKSQRDE
jgi:tripartite-type tricarboxylate transporter receptor subunit TctC